MRAGYEYHHGLPGDVDGQQHERARDDPQRAALTAGPGAAVELPDATVEATISISESTPKPDRATEPAAIAARIRIAVPTTFQASVAYSSTSPRRSSMRSVAVTAKAQRT